MDFQVGYKEKTLYGRLYKRCPKCGAWSPKEQRQCWKCDYDFDLGIIIPRKDSD